MGRLRNSGRAFRRDRSGASLVEFGLIAPILATVVLGVAKGATLLLANNAMHTAVTSGAQYVMAGGQDLSTVQSITLSAWPNRSSAAAVTAAKSCLCGTASSDCSTLCSDQSVPLAYVTLTATDTYAGLAGTVPLTATQTIRIR